MDVAGARALMDDGAVLVDVRTAGEWKTEHAPVARHVPLDQLERRAGDLPADTPIVVMCQSGVRSAQGARMLRARGVDAHSLRGGILAWKRAGERVVGGRR
ncbi:rhodanese-like domain-containing protein [Homoserinibacter sp. GY 40078]|uniref:rhodanese-like domain-containing protein n=1 Tax=Homoserinibacter sp. GY 40078 TaxID=2603275 RepID=UPI0021052450|nr:rhodanese-like domain-containing protein [Homoserinibacter sp. GY 40078]